MGSRGRKQPLWRDLPGIGIIQWDPSPSCGPEQTFHPEKRAELRVEEKVNRTC